MSHGGEKQLWLELNDERRAFLSAVPAEAHERKLALWTLGVSALVFLAAVPFAKLQLAPVPAFIPIYQSALVVCDLITAVLLFSQFSFLGARALLALAAGYLFTACMAAAHALTFPGLFAPAGLLGAGPQSTAWMYMFWHAGFPALVIAYALLKKGSREHAQVMPASGARKAVVGCIAGVVAAACAFTFMATGGQEYLPQIMQGNGYTPVLPIVVSSVWALSALALVVLWRRPPHTVLDLWVMVVMCAWLFDIGLSGVFNGGRYDLGFYTGRIYGLLTASFVLIVLLVENGRLYGRLLNAYAGERRERQLVQEKSAQLIAANKELDAFSYSVSHDLRAPLRAMDGYARLLEEDFSARLDDEGRRLLGVVRSSAKKMGRLIDDLLEFSRLGRHEPHRSRVDMAALAHEVAAELAIAGPRAQISIGELPAALADRSLIKQVWRNLLGNALKFSAKRRDPQVEVGARREAAETVFWVRDNGAGFDMRYADRLFGVFQRLHRAEEFPGTGVGLAIVQRIVVRHGGRVWAEARPEVGATFHFSLPAEGDHAAG